MTFTSRWVEAPDHVTEMPGGLPAGFRASGVAASFLSAARPFSTSSWNQSGWLKASASPQ